MSAGTTGVTEAQKQADTALRQFISAFELDRAFAFERFGHVLDRPEIRAAFTRAAHGRGLTVADLVPEMAGRNLPEYGSWVQIVDVDNAVRYGRQIGFDVVAGMTFYALPHDAEDMTVTVHFPYAGRTNKTRSAEHSLRLPLRLARVETPAGPVMFFPREYLRLDTADAFSAATEGATFTALDLDGTGVSEEWMFYLRSRGIPAAEALVLLAHAVRSGRFGYFRPSADFDRWATSLHDLFERARGER